MCSSTFSSRNRRVRTSTVLLSIIFTITLLSTAYGDVTEYLDQKIEPAGLGGSFAAPANSIRSPAVLSYLISTKHFSQPPEGELGEQFVKARMFLGNSAFAGPTMIWNNSSVNGDWTNLKRYIAIDPCRGMQAAEGPAWLLVDTSNVTLLSDIAVSSNPLRILDHQTPFSGDASNCIISSSPIDGTPHQCDQYFFFNFSSHIPPPTTGYKWGFTVRSKTNVPLPFSGAIVAAGPSCPSLRGGDENSWFNVHFDPSAPGNSPTSITVSSLAIGTAYQKWWVLLKVPEKTSPGSTPFTITASYETITPPSPPSPPVTPPPSPSPTNPPPGAPSTAPSRPKKQLPLWAIAIISVGCILLAAGALFWAWRVSKQKPSQSSYEFY